MADLSPHRFFAAWRVEAPFPRFPVPMGSTLALSLTRSLTVHDAASCPMEDPLYECGRPYDTMSSLFFTALWLQRSQSILVQEVQPAKDIDLTCYRDQGHHMLTSGAHVTGVAGGSNCKI